MLVTGLLPPAREAHALSEPEAGGLEEILDNNVIFCPVKPMC